MRILSIDPGLKCGWAVFDDEVYIAGGTHCIKTPTKAQVLKKGVHPSQKWLDVRNMIHMFINDWNPNIVAFEEVKRHVGTYAAHCYGYIRYTIEAECANQNIETISYIPSQWRKLIGKGSDGKLIVQERVGEYFNIENFDSDDHSDAVGIGWAAFIEKKSLQD